MTTTLPEGAATSGDDVALAQRLKRGYDDLAVNELLMVPKVELSEHAWSPNARPFLVVAEDVADLVLDKKVRKAVVLAAGLAAFEVAEMLAQAPEVRRGRPASD